MFEKLSFGTALHLIKAVLLDCWEHRDARTKSFRWVRNSAAESVGLHNIHFSPTVQLAAFPPGYLWCQLLNILKDTPKQTPNGILVTRHTEQHYWHKKTVFSETGAAVLSYYILKYERAIKKGTSDHLSVYAAELVAILIASQWTEENNKSNVAFDSWAAPSSI